MGQYRRARPPRITYHAHPPLPPLPIHYTTNPVSSRLALGAAVMEYPETASLPGPNELGYVSYPHSLLAHHMICFLGGITGIHPVEISLACDVCCGPNVAHGTRATPHDDPGRPLSAPQCPLHVASVIAPRYTRITYPPPHQGPRNNSWRVN